MIKVLSHYDLDGITCVINIWNSIKNKQNFEYKLTGYNNLDKCFNNLTKGYNELVWITDLNFNEEQMIKLTKFDKCVKVLYIDHHVYPYDVESITKDVKHLFTRINKDYCGCLNTFLFLSKLYGKHASYWNERKLQLVELNKIVDIYDRWQKDNPLFFEKAIPLNDLFWDYGFEKFFLKFRDGYKLDDEDLERIDLKSKERKEYLDIAYSEYSVINQDTKSLFILNPNSKFSNDFTLYYPGYEYYVIIKSIEDDMYQFSIRIAETNNTTVHILIEELEKKGIDVAAGGHAKTGGFAVKKENVDAFLKNINEVFGEQINA